LAAIADAPQDGTLLPAQDRSSCAGSSVDLPRAMRERAHLGTQKRAARR
jgi:hypothetical protein